MNSINMGKVIVGGVVAGVVFMIGGYLAEMLQGTFITAVEGTEAVEPGGNFMAAMTFYTIGVGIATAWIYAAIRPRFGPGPATAVKASTAVWAIWSVFGFSTTYWMGILTGDVVVFSVICAFIYMNAGGYVAAMMYQEDGGGGNAASSVSTTETSSEYVKN